MTKVGDGRNVTEVYWSVRGVQNKTVTQGMEERWHRSAKGAWLHGVLECISIV